MELDPSLTTGPESYRLDVSTDRVRITAPTARGLFYGSRSMLRILARDDDRSGLPVGTAADWPDYPSRGFMLDVGRRFFTPEFIRVMGWYKVNELQLHLNDNEIKGLLRGDRRRQRGGARPRDRCAGTREGFIAFKPELGLNGGNSDHLDLSKPESTAFMKSVFDEFTPWFRGKDVRYGTDEYPADRQLYRKFFNDMAAHLRTLGKHPRAWGSATAMTGTADGYDRDVTINSWNNGWYGPDAAVRDGYSFINTNDAYLYIVPFADYYHGNGLSGQWLYDNWEPHVFPAARASSRASRC